MMNFEGGVKMDKINISLDDELLERCDKATKKFYTSRSGLISMALSQFLLANEMTYAISDLSNAMRKIADTGAVDDDTYRQLEEFERFAELLNLKK